MSRSGIDEFYEILRIILAKTFAERQGIYSLPDINQCNEYLDFHAAEIGEILDGSLKIQSPPDIFPDIQVIMDGVSITRQDFTAIDLAFEQLTSRSYKADKGQYFTPRHVVDMCVRAVDPKPGELICDPACGSGAFLKSAYTHAMREYLDTPELYGFDYSHRASQVARFVSLIGTSGAIKVAQLDSLKLPLRGTFQDNKETIESYMGKDFIGYDAIITNPPFAGDVSSDFYSSNYDMASIYNKKLERDILFIERCINLLKIGGRLAIILPDNKVSSKSFSALRLWIGKNTKIRSVVSLHRYTFLPYTGQKTSVVFAIRQPASKIPYETPISFFRSDSPGKTSNGSPVYLPNADTNEPHFDTLDHDLREISSEIRSSLCAR
jgi:type I restriction-modification system DNA methylase subunit